MLTKILNRGANALKNALRGIDFGKLQTSDGGLSDDIFLLWAWEKWAEWNLGILFKNYGAILHKRVLQKNAKSN